MSRLVTILAISRLINHQDSLRCGSRRWVLAQQFEPLRLYLPLIPIRLREKPLQRLGSRQLCSYHRLGVDQSGERLVSFAWQKETLHIASKSFTLITLAKQGIKLSHILFQWCWGSCYFDAFCHLLLCLLCPHATTLSPCQQTTDNMPILYIQAKPRKKEIYRPEFKIFANASSSAYSRSFSSLCFNMSRLLVYFSCSSADRVGSFNFSCMRLHPSRV